MTHHAEIVGWGKYLPSKVVTNDDLARTLDTSDEWISSHTGIRERRVAQAGETAVSMAVAAARGALAVAEVQPTDLDLIIVSTYTPDYHLPGAAPMVQAELGASRAAAFDLRAGCPGFVYGLAIGSQFIATGTYRRVLVIGSEITSHFVNWQDRRTCVLFGDGAGAVVLEASERTTGVLSFALGTKGDQYDAMIYRAAGSRHPTTAEPFEESLRYLQIDGQRVLQFSARTVGPAITEQLGTNGLSVDDIALVIPQQSNLKFMEWISKKLGFPMDKIFVNVDKYANTSSASIAVALCEAFEQGRIQDGDNVLLVSFGAGLNWATSVIRCGVSEREPEIILDTTFLPLLKLQEMRKRVALFAQTAVANITSVLNLAALPFFSSSKKK